MPPLTALLDANVLYPAGLRDILLRLADQYIYAPLWSADIHAEWMSQASGRPDGYTPVQSCTGPARSWMSTFRMLS